ncbi:phosphotransferase family enzyme [Streptomyces sp. PanSC19]|uniref:phosphotransferase n=1 Tax=Streptomyces sp. PanSC19 TaxID=1520455 RepID=UPI000F4A9F66|nr:phosphotransferase family enzyme [Streptomyces sp. PanSC19]
MPRTPRPPLHPRESTCGPSSLEGFPLSYSMTRRLAGTALARSWDALDATARRTAVDELSGMPRALHAWSPPADLADTLVARDGLHEGLDGMLGADITPLPTSRALALVDHGKALPHVDPGLMADAAHAIEEYRHLEPAVDDPSRHGVIHGDVHLENLWWSGPGVGVLDL